MRASLLPLNLRVLPWLFASQSVLAATSTVAPDYNREVRPILARYCFKCHGPDDKSRKGELRLDIREEATRAAKSGAKAVVPGKIEESELIARILTQDADELMPPPATKTEITEAQKDILKRWVTAGAPYAPHWAFQPPVKPAVPGVPGAHKGVGGAESPNPIDAFVQVRLAAEGLQPAPSADRYTLLRRVSYDLTGMPPSPELTDRFVGDVSPNAYEKVVDTLLQSPRYGERWARKWLDLARYADTNGYEKDRNRSIWPYRDWVINALNADMPFDQFTIEQIAGDMLPNATPQQIVATGFHRNTMLNEEGGIDPLEFRFHAMADRVATTGKTWLGMTTGCAQCHTHKFDPITHREYYQMMAFLNNADEPEFLVKPADFESRRVSVEALIARKTDELRSKFKIPETAPESDTRSLEERREAAIELAFAEWLRKERAGVSRWTVLRPQSVKANLPLLTVLEDHSILASGDQTKADVYRLKYQLPQAAITAIRLEVLPDERLPAGGPGRTYYEGPRGDFNLSNLKATLGGSPLKFSGATASFEAKNMPASAAIDDNLQSGWSTNGAQGKRHTAVFTLAEPGANSSELEMELFFERHYSADLGRFRIAVTTDSGAITARDTSDEVAALLLLPEAQLDPEQKQGLFREFLLRTPELEAARDEIQRLRKSLQAFPTTLVMKERPADLPRPTFIHNRGEFLQPGEQVEPGVFGFLNPLPPGAARTRLEFARWLVSKENPLTARVTVNRDWASFFGRGLVRTVDDFGYQGETPSHPELLDYLAVDFMEQGWSLKKLHKTIVMSLTYQQSSVRTGESASSVARDPQNLLLSRGPRVRLEAEMIRDGMLVAAGVLSERVGGPSVYPPQPAGVTEVAYGNPKWKTSEGPDRYRRGLYTFSKRTASYAMFTAFDAPVGDVCVAQREVSDTPLQALTLLNDVVILEAAQAVGRRLTATPGTLEERVEFLFRSCFTRPPSGDESRRLVEFYQQQKIRSQAGEIDGAALAGTGEGDVHERAAWTALGRALFNLDEAITKG